MRSAAKNQTSPNEGQKGEHDRLEQCIGQNHGDCRRARETRRRDNKTDASIADAGGKGHGDPMSLALTSKRPSDADARKREGQHSGIADGPDVEQEPVLNGDDQADGREIEDEAHALRRA